MAENKPAISPEKMEELMRLMDALPPTKPPKVIPPNQLLECACGHKVHISSFDTINTGVFTCLNNVCRHCKTGQQMDREYARLVCVKCKKVLLRVKPAKDKTGFSFVGGRTYHITSCPECHPEIENPIIIEKATWDRNHNMGPQESVKKQLEPEKPL